VGAKDWLIFYANRDIPGLLRERPQLDRSATDALVSELFSQRRVDALDDGSLDATNPPDDLVLAAVWPGVSVVCAGELAVDYPSQLDTRFLRAGRGSTIYLHAMHSVVDWFAYAMWDAEGELVRSLSLAPDHGLIENIGEPLAFEQPYWNGQHPAVDAEEEDEDGYPFAFHPLELAEEALSSLFGFVYEGVPSPSHVEPWNIPLASYRLSPRKRRALRIRRH
jgi:hypothetical protein